ncbi:hypothetical protein ACGTNG_12555 [Halomonas sp. 1390]|uniref:hypothetical protein n=1 Tax=Halomonas sp. B23F22_3 TaxID=3459516 RepID=UPI00373F5837
MKKQKGTHRSMGKTGGVQAGLESGVASTEKVGNTNPDQVGSTGRVKPQSHGSIATKR